MDRTAFRNRPAFRNRKRGRIISAVFAAIALVLILPVSSFGQDDPPEKKVKIEGKRCPYCKTTGRLPNPFYETHRHLEDEVLFCSYAIEKDKVGHGIPWIPCKRCKNEKLKAEAEEEFEKKVAILFNWLEKRREIDETLKVPKPLLHMRTEHFNWAWSIPKFKGADKRMYNAHTGLHLYASRMEKFYRDWQKVHKVTDKDNINNVHNIFCFERQRIAMKACPIYAHLASPNGKTSKQGTLSVYVTWWNKSKTPSDEDFHGALVHNVNHLFTAVYKNHWWLHECAIAYEGSSHWWEIYYFGRAIARCFVETDSGAGWRQYKWQSIVKKAVIAGKQPKMVDMLTTPGTSLKGEHHPFAWSYIDYMMSIDAHKVMDFFLVIKQKKHPREAFKKAFGMSIPGFQKAWEEWVIGTYNVQDESPAIPRRLRFR